MPASDHSQEPSIALFFDFTCSLLFARFRVRSLKDLSRFRGEAGARRLSAKQKESLRKVLEKMPIPIAVGSNQLDSEAQDLASDFIAALTSANWKVVPRVWLPSGKYGLFIGTTDKDRLDSPPVKLLRDALKEIHTPAVPLELTTDDKSLFPPPQPHALYLLIGTHPPISAMSPTSSKTAKR